MNETPGTGIPRRAPGSHPEPEALFLARRAPTRPESVPVLEHAAVCARCSEELVRIEAFEETPVDPLFVSASRARTAWRLFSGKRRRFFRIPVPVFAAAAAALIAVAVVFVPRRPPDVVRGGGSGGTFSPVGDVREAPAAFVFPRSGARAVRVTVFDAGRTYAWTSPPFQPGEPVVFPESERAKLAPGVAYTWTVLGVESTLPSQTFRITR